MLHGGFAGKRTQWRDAKCCGCIFLQQRNSLQDLKLELQLASFARYHSAEWLEIYERAKGAAGVQQSDIQTHTMEEVETLKCFTLFTTDYHSAT